MILASNDKYWLIMVETIDSIKSGYKEKMDPYTAYKGDFILSSFLSSLDLELSGEDVYIPIYPD